MQCEWMATSDNKFKCIHCGFVVPKASFKHRCGAGEPHAGEPHKIAENIRPSPPNLVKRAVNFGKAAYNHIVTGRYHCSDDEKERRFNICSSNKCGLFIKQNENEPGVCSHKSCGCFIRNRGKFLDKLSWAESKCPVGLWGAAEPNLSENPENGV